MQNPDSFGLASPLLGIDLKAEEVLERILGQHESITLNQRPEHATGHESYEVHYQGLPIFRGFLQLYRLDGKIRGLTLRVPTDIRDFGTYKTEHQLGLTDGAIWFPTEEGLTAAIQSYQISDSGLPVLVVTDLGGQLLHQETMRFHTDVTKALIYPTNLPTAQTSEVELQGLTDRNYLRGPEFQIYGATKSSPRAFPDFFGYKFDPVDQAMFFDQAQTYYNSSLVMNFFRRMGFEHAGELVEIYTNAPLMNNAQYIPSFGSNPSRIELGTGDKVSLWNLSRDRDVIAHEFSHHIIYRHIRATRGEAGILHEGFADYFTYAISGDRFLGETIVPGRSWLRSANVTETTQDALPANMTIHQHGSYWSGLLWVLRGDLGDTYFDQVVYNSLQFLSPNPTIAEALQGLAFADTEATPHEDPNLMGPNFCHIVSRAEKMGFMQHLAHWNSQTCVNQSKPRPKVNSAGAKDHGMLACGAIHPSGTPFGLMVLLFLPLGIFFFRASKNHEH